MSGAANTTRETILARIRRGSPATPSEVKAAHDDIARAYHTHGEVDQQACMELLIDRLLDYDTEVVEINEESELPQTVMQVLDRAGEKILLVGTDFPTRWLPVGPVVNVDDALSTETIERSQAVLTTCEAAVASTGTIVLVHGGSQGRRILTLLPDHHICLVRRDQIYERLPAVLARSALASGRPITTISGPSATSDIEMTRIRGVHGPRRLTVILYGGLSHEVLSL